jgi:hypothetical protein
MQNTVAQQTETALQDHNVVNDLEVRMNGQRTMMWTLMMLFVFVIGVSGVAGAASITWNTTSGTWDTVSTNTPWINGSGDPVPYTDGDDVHFRRHIPAGTHTIAIQAGGVAPSSFTTHAGSGNTYQLVFQGGRYRRWR